MFLFAKTFLANTLYARMKPDTSATRQLSGIHPYARTEPDTSDTWSSVVFTPTHVHVPSLLADSHTIR
jgi:hypothetical protein